MNLGRLFGDLQELALCMLEQGLSGRRMSVSSSAFLPGCYSTVLKTAFTEEAGGARYGGACL